VVILGAGILAGAGVIPGYVSLLVQAGVIGYVLGRLRESMVHSERARQQAVGAVESYIASMHMALVDGDVPDEYVEQVEADMAGAQRMLEVLDSCAPTRVQLWPPKVVRRAA
jgi:hypothetical protein